MSHISSLVGVLAFQGDFAEHMQVLHSLNAEAIEVRNLEDLAKVDRLIIPGGESTVMAKFLESTGMRQQIIARVEAEPNAKSQKPLAVYGTCAGAILLAKEVTGKNSPQPLGLMDITVDRNAYGTQLQSFEADIVVKNINTPIHCSFIRSPKITRVGPDVEILASHEGVPVLVRQGRLLAATFHPEVRGNTVIHEMFLAL